MVRTHGDTHDVTPRTVIKGGGAVVRPKCVSDDDPDGCGEARINGGTRHRNLPRQPPLHRDLRPQSARPRAVPMPPGLKLPEFTSGADVYVHPLHRGRSSDAGVPLCIVRPSRRSRPLRGPPTRVRRGIPSRSASKPSRRQRDVRSSQLLQHPSEMLVPPANVKIHATPPRSVISS